MISLGCVGIKRSPEQPIAVLTYNIHHGEGTDGRLDLDRIARIILASQADLVALQEIDQNTTRTGRNDQAAELARLTGMYYVFGKAMDFQGGAYGQAILSRWRIAKSEVHQLPQQAGREPRILLRAQIHAPGGELVLASTHLDHQIEHIRVAQAEALNNLLPANGPAPVVLAGDFNAVPSSPPMLALRPNWRDAGEELGAPTIPARNPSRRIDYILLAPRERWQVLRTTVLEEPVASDHRPVLALLRRNADRP
jgi:endonuclease/exonuclease/phosphatase family metal-dependent hydrolase